MKNIIGCIAIGLVVFLSQSCDKESENGITNAKVSDRVQEGSWRITFFKDENVDNTADFSGYDFSFGANNVVTAFNGTNIHSGTWAVGTDDSDPKLLINYGIQATFGALGNDWSVDQLEVSRIALSNEISGGGGMDYLTLEKN